MARPRGDENHRLGGNSLAALAAAHALTHSDPSTPRYGFLHVPSCPQAVSAAERSAKLPGPVARMLKLK